MNSITFENNTRERDWTDLEWINEFYHFLQGEIPQTLHYNRGHKPKMSQKKAFAIIYYLQEHYRKFPDNIEQCSVCGDLYDTDCEGLYWETKGKFYCDNCIYLVPENYDRGKR